MIDLPCYCHLIDDTLHLGILVRIDLQQQLLYYRRQQQERVATIQLQRISHLYYHQTPDTTANSPLPFEIQFAGGDQLSGIAHGHYQDDHGDHLIQLQQPNAPLHLLLPGGSRHQLQLSTTPPPPTTEHQIIEQVDALFTAAVRQRASDIHLRPQPRQAEVTFRIDGKKVHFAHYPEAHYPAIVSRIKLLGEMDIASHRHPQDGACHHQIDGRPVDLRISTMPVLEGESVVIRVLDPSRGLRTLTEIGLAPDDEQRFRMMLQRDHGLLLVTGPTGSGKSTTLYAAMQVLRERGVNIISLEDPVEYRIDQVRQVEINEQTGNTFARTLRHLLRHDPDVILIGEIRDEETAKIALQSAYTGHLVLSTLHTNDAPATISRLLEMGMEPYTLKDTLIGVLSQRLVRRNCLHCTTTPEGPSPTCPHCGGSGFHGRLPLYELMAVTPAIRDQIGRSGSSAKIRQVAEREGMESLMGYARRLIESRQISPNELGHDDSR